MRIESGSIAYDPVENPLARHCHVVKFRKDTSLASPWIVGQVISNPGKDGEIIAQDKAFEHNRSRNKRKDLSVASPGFLQSYEPYYRNPEPGETPSDIIAGIPVVEEIHTQTDGFVHQVVEFRPRK